MEGHPVVAPNRAARVRSREQFEPATTISRKGAEPQRKQNRSFFAAPRLCVTSRFFTASQRAVSRWNRIWRPGT